MKELIRHVRRWLRCLIGKDIWLHPELEVATEFHGTDYGGWAIVHDSLHPASIIYSFGIGEDASFDLGLIARYGCLVQAFDPTPKSLAWVAAHIGDARFRMHPWALGGSDGSLRLFLPKNREHVSASLFASSLMSDDYFDAECYRLTTVMQKLNHQHIDVLKLDIEGAEYEVIADLCSSGRIRQVDQLLVEFHHWMPSIRVNSTKMAVTQLRQAGFRLLWVSRTGHEALFRYLPEST